MKLAAFVRDRRTRSNVVFVYGLNSRKWKFRASIIEVRATKGKEFVLFIVANER